jgi:hypothetical protein
VFLALATCEEDLALVVLGLSPVLEGLSDFAAFWQEPLGMPVARDH